jgi:hypothetical protein
MVIDLGLSGLEDDWPNSVTLTLSLPGDSLALRCHQSSYLDCCTCLPTGRDVIEKCELQSNSEKTLIFTSNNLCRTPQSLSHFESKYYGYWEGRQTDNELRLSKYAIIYLLVYKSVGTVRQRHEKIKLLKMCATPFFL